MHTLTQWKARRAGGRITVTGTERDGSAGKIVGVDYIEPREGLIVAVDKHGAEHRLMYGPEHPEEQPGRQAQPLPPA